ncbi:hypothetical protein REPUB_Repub04eG0181500 [Reevesia pubescens]
MTSGTRMSTWKESENNKRKRRAFAVKIFSAGLTIEEDGTTYKKGCKPLDRMDIVGGTASASPCSSYHPSPCASYNPSPGLSSFPSPSHYTADTNGNTDANSLILWLKNLSSGLSSASSKLAHHLYIAGGSISAHVTPPLSSLTS